MLMLDKFRLESKVGIGIIIVALITYYLTMFFVKKNHLIVQVRIFLTYRPHGISVDGEDEAILHEFVRLSGKLDVSELDHIDVMKFHDQCVTKLTKYQTLKAMRVVRLFLQYYHFNSVLKKPGRPIEIEKRLKAKTLIESGYSMREVCKALDLSPSSVSLVHRWYHQPLPEKGEAKR